MPKTSSVRPDISIELQLVTDINTDRHRAMVVPAVAWSRAGTEMKV